MTDTEQPHPENPKQRRKRLQAAIARLQTKARGLGPVDPHFDMKAFTDEGWEGPKGDFSKTDLA